MRTSVEKMLTSDKPDLQGVGSLTLAYRVKLYPSRVKGDMLGMLCTLFQREHHKALDLLDGIVAQEGKLVLRGKSQAGEGEFKQRVRYRAVNDYRRARKAAKALKKQMKLPYLQAELCDAAEVQEPRKATGFDLWVHMEGMSRDCQLYLPARKHKAINRALEHPGATLSKSTQVMRRKGNWYAVVYVKCPLTEVRKPAGWIGIDVGVRSSVITSDGRRSASLHPVIKQETKRRGDQQRVLIHHRKDKSYQRQVLDREARKLVTLAAKSGRGLVLENHHRLIRWKQHAARSLANRVELAASLVGVAVRLVNPAYTSLTCSHCGSRDTFRRRLCFRCHSCGLTINADVNAARNIRARGAVGDTAHA